MSFLSHASTVQMITHLATKECLEPKVTTGLVLPSDSSAEDFL